MEIKLNCREGQYHFGSLYRAYMIKTKISSVVQMQFLKKYYFVVISRWKITSRLIVRLNWNTFAKTLMKKLCNLFAFGKFWYFCAISKTCINFVNIHKEPPSVFTHVYRAITWDCLLRTRVEKPEGSKYAASLCFLICVSVFLFCNQLRFIGDSSRICPVK